MKHFSHVVVKTCCVTSSLIRNVVCLDYSMTPFSWRTTSFTFFFVYIFLRNDDFASVFSKKHCSAHFMIHNECPSMSFIATLILSRREADKRKRNAMNETKRYLSREERPQVPCFVSLHVLLVSFLLFRVLLLFRDSLLLSVSPKSSKKGCCLCSLLPAFEDKDISSRMLFLVVVQHEVQPKKYTAVQ